MASRKSIGVVIILYCLSFVVIGQNTDQDGDEESTFKKEDGQILEGLIALFRHGARGPVGLIPGDPNNYFWLTLGLGQLSNIGKQQQFSNGQITRKRYDKFLGPIYNSSYFYIQSTNYDRCVMSGQAFTTGLFPSRQFQIWEEGCLGHNWQPIPVFTTDLANTNADFAPFYQLFSRAASDPTIYSRNKDTIEALKNATGITSSNGTAVFIYADALIAEIYNNDSLPFGLATHKDGFFRLNDDIFDYCISKTYPVLAAIIFKDMMDRIQSLINGTSSVKTNVYSMSDIHVASCLTALTNRTFGEPRFASTFYLELYKPDKTINTHYFMLWYRPTLQDETTALYIRGCGYKCPNLKFRNLVDQIYAESNALMN